MIDPGAVDFFDPPEADLERESYTDAGLTPRAEAERMAALWHIHRARACLAAVADLLRVAPGKEADTQANAWAEQFEVECGRVGEHIAGMRQVRECRGEA